MGYGWCFVKAFRLCFSSNLSMLPNALHVRLHTILLLAVAWQSAAPEAQGRGIWGKHAAILIKCCFCGTPCAAYRFYFLSNEELLDILSQSKNPQAVQPHLQKCFDGIRALEFSPEEKSIDVLALLSSEGEKLPLAKVTKVTKGLEIAGYGKSLTFSWDCNHFFCLWQYHISAPSFQCHILCAAI
jgi:hypothetical protein